MPEGVTVAEGETMRLPVIAVAGSGCLSTRSSARGEAVRDRSRAKAYSTASTAPSTTGLIWVTVASE